MKLRLFLFILPVLLMAGCNDGHDDFGQLYVNPIIDVLTEGATAEIDQETKEIDLVYTESRDFSNLSLELVLEPNVRMVNPSGNPFNIDLSDEEVKTITVWSLDRDISYNIRAYRIIDISRPLTSFTATAGGYNADVDIDYEARIIYVVFDHYVDLSAVMVGYQLANGVTVESPTDMTWDLTNSVTLKMKKEDMMAEYTVIGSIGIDDSKPFDNFVAQSGGESGNVVVDHQQRTVRVTFDSNNIDITNIGISYDLDAGFEVVRPVSNVWDVSDGLPVEFVLTKNGLEVSYEITFEVVIDFTGLFTDFSASSGGDDAMVVIDYENRWISVAFEGNAALSTVNVNYTLSPNVTVESPAGTTWDLSSATEASPMTLTVKKYGVEVEFEVFAAANLFVPPFMSGSRPADWIRYIKGVPATMAVYKVPQWNGGGVINAYAIAVQETETIFRTVGDGYGSMATLDALAARVPDANIVINGGDAPNLLMVDGQILNNVEGNDGNFAMMQSSSGKMYLFSATNRIDKNGVPCGPDGDGAHFVDDIYWWDNRAHYPGIVSLGPIGAGFLNYTAGQQGNAAFPDGVYVAADGNTLDVQVAYGAAQGENTFMFFVCEKSAGSEGVTQKSALEIIRDMGAWNGGLGTVGNRSLIGLYIGGNSLIEPLNGTRAPMGYAFTMTAK